MTEIEFTPFPKIARWAKDVVVTEKIDGTNASVWIGPNGEFKAGSRTRWITPGDDNYGFAAWAQANKEELLKLGPGHHFGEWWGRGIQRNYGLNERRFSLFNTGRWNASNVPVCCSVVPVLYTGVIDAGEDFSRAITDLALNGSKAAPGFMNPEGVMIYHTAGHVMFEWPFDDGQPKSSRVVQ